MPYTYRDTCLLKVWWSEKGAIALISFNIHQIMFKNFWLVGVRFYVQSIKCDVYEESKILYARRMKFSAANFKGKVANVFSIGFHGCQAFANMLNLRFQSSKRLVHFPYKRIIVIITLTSTTKHVFTRKISGFKI